MAEHMKLALVVIGDGRGHYLHQTVRSVTTNVLHPINNRIMIDDSGDLNYGLHLDETYPEYTVIHGGRRGMAGAVQTGFETALAGDPDYILWIEEDMPLTNQLPITEAARVLDNHRNLAQMCFRRDPWQPEEFPCQLRAIMCQSKFTEVHDDYTTYDFLFSLNPCLIPKRVAAMGWPSGPIGIGNEAGMTTKCLDAGYIFASWGQPNDGQSWARHIGEYRGTGWQL